MPTAATSIADFNLDSNRLDDPSYNHAKKDHFLAMEESGLTFRGPATSTFFSHSEFGDGRRESILDHAYAAGLDTEISIMSYAATDHRPVVVRASCVIASLKHTDAVSNDGILKSVANAIAGPVANSAVAALQVVINDITRTITGKTRNNRFPVAKFLNISNLSLECIPE